jgi:DNA-binding beta-propeller fold protein YncE
LIRLKVSFSAATARSGFELFGELVITGQDVVAVVYGENITKGSPVVVKIDFDPTKLPNPDTLPTGYGYGCAFDPTGTYLAVAHGGSPCITIYKRSGDTFTKLPNPDTLPTGYGYGCAFDPTGTYLAVAHDISPCITIYKRSGDTFTKLPNPAILPSNCGYGCAFDPTGTYLAVAHVSSPCITIYNGFSRTVFKTGNSLLDIQEGGVIAVGYAREDGLTGETKEIVRIWRAEG